jgi:hypothetical protein
MNLWTGVSKETIYAANSPGETQAATVLRNAAETFAGVPAVCTPPTLARRWRISSSRVDGIERRNPEHRPVLSPT